MKGVNIVAKTPAGERAIRQALSDGKKAPWAQRKAYEQLYRELIVSERPFTARIEHRSERLERVLPPSYLVPTLKEALLQNGAVESDYVVVLDE